MANKLCFVLLILCFRVNSSPLENIGRQYAPRHLLISPERLTSGTTNRLCISRLGSATQGRAVAQVELQSLVPLLSQDRGSRRHRPIARVRKTFGTGNGGCFDMLVPKSPHRKVRLHLRMRFDALPEYKVNERKNIRLHHDANLVIIQMDKPLYRAGNNVRFRILQLKPELTPLQMPIYRISIEAPPDMFGGGTKVVQWSNVSTQLGLVEKEYQLDKYAQQGEWRILVESRDMSTRSTVQTFQVTDYALPSFHVSVDYDSDILLTYKQLNWTICAKYMYGEGVNGKLRISVSSDSYESQNIISAHELHDSKGCLEYSLRTKLLGFENPDDRPKTVVANIAFQEEGTKTWKNTTAISHVSQDVVKIEYVNVHNIFFKPGLPLKVKVKVTNWKNIEVPQAKVQFCRNANTQTAEIDNIQELEVLYDGRDANVNNTLPPPMALSENCETGMTDSKGFVSFAFSVDKDQQSDIINLKSLVLDHPLKEYEIPTKEFKIASTSITLNAWGNLSKINMEIGSPLFGTSDMQPNSRHTFPVFLTLDPAERIRPILLHYVLITRSGMLLRWGASSQCPRPIHDVQNIQTVFGPVSDGINCPEEEFYNVEVYKLMVPVKISHLMCPYSHLLVYFVRPDGEIVVANKYFKVKECFPYKVSQKWIPNNVPPSSTTVLHLQSVGPALCLLGVTNRALQHVTSQHSIHGNISHKIMSVLESRFDKTHAYMVDEICFSDHKSKITNMQTRRHYENTVRTFLTSGLELLTDALPRVVECPVDATQKPLEISYLHNKHPKDRSYFPESWLWDIRIMDSNGSLDIQTSVPDDITEWESQVFCLSRAGIAIPIPHENTNLKVFQPFFIELSTPKVIKRGEDVQMLYKIFNYMDHTIPVSIDLEITPIAAATLTSHEIFEVSHHICCIHPGQSLVNHFSIRAHQLRNINITVSAQIQNNMHYLCHVSTNEQSPNDVRDRVIKEIIVEPEGLPTEKHKSGLLCIDANTNKTEFSWALERVDCVDNSENWFISLVGDITGPMAMNVENLISMPVGCGEQNMMMIAYNLIALEFSLAGKRVSAEIKQSVIKNLIIGYQRQLTYWHSDTGAFSAFGRTDGVGSTWLTAFCLKYLQKLHDNWSIGTGNSVLPLASKWLLNKQMENGCFRNTGQVFHREMKGGLRSDTSNIALAAYVIISLIDSNSPMLKLSVVQNTAYCLAALKYNNIIRGRAKETLYTKNPDRVYTFALATLAQLKIEKYEQERERLNKNDVVGEKRFVKREVLSEMFSDMSYRQRNLYRHHQKPFNNEPNTEDNLRGPAGNVLFEEDEEIPVVRENGYLAGGGMNALMLLRSMAQRDGDMMWWEAGSLPVSIETTGYAILSLLFVGGEENILDAMAASRWLSLHRNDKGGFISTQDTLIAVDALCSLRQSLPNAPPLMTVMIQGPGRGRHFVVSPAEKHKLHTVVIREVDQIDISPKTLKIRAEGKGCLLVQVTQRYNILARPTQNSPFRLFTKLTTDGTFNCQDNKCMCAAVLEVCVSWYEASGISFPEMALLEVQLPTGYILDRTLLYRQIKKENILLRRIEESSNADTVYMYLSLSSQLSAVRPTECYNLYLMGPQSHTQPVSARVYDYYHSETVQTASYIVPASCPYDNHRKPHEEPVNSGLFMPTMAETIDFDSDWHVIDSEYDLEIPRSMEGVPPMYALPPENFNKHFYQEFTTKPIDDTFPQEETSHLTPFQNWTFLDVDVDLEVPSGLEQNQPVWVLPPNNSFRPYPTAPPPHHIIQEESR